MRALPFLLAAFVCLFPEQARAHPHVFVTHRVQAVFDTEGLAAFVMEWTFDEMFTALIVADHDADKDGSISPAESAAIKAGAFDNLRDFGYFTHIRIDGEPFPVQGVEGFVADRVDGRLRYRFTVPCRVAAPPGAGPKQVMVSVYDPDYYADYWLDEEKPVQLTGAEPVAVTVDVDESSDVALYYGSFRPQEITLTLAGS